MDIVQLSWAHSLQFYNSSCKWSTNDLEAHGLNEEDEDILIDEKEFHYVHTASKGL